MTIVSLDLGTTRIKGATLGASGRVEGLRAEAAPPLTAAGEAVTGEADAYVGVATALLDRLLERTPPPWSLALACQRSSFLLWERATGTPVTPLISWQDRSGAAWCARHRHRAAAITGITGLPLSPHYVGPKLAALLEERPDLRPPLEGGALCVGTLESFLLFSLSGGSLYRTDLSMASRTLLVDPVAGGWSGELLEIFGLAGLHLPEVGPSVGLDRVLRPHLHLAVSLADQSAAALALLGGDTGATVVNLGTGGFVLHPTGRVPVRLPGFPATPLLAGPEGVPFALEGTVNGAGAALDRFGRPPTSLPEVDPAPEAFCLPDVAGVGAPHWRPDLGLTLSRAARTLDPAGRRRVVLEGLLFRLREIIEAIAPQGGRVVVAGGAARDPAVGAGLAALLGRPVEVAEGAEATLVGAAALAATSPLPPLPARTVAPGPAGTYLAAKYPRWRRWLAALLARGDEADR